MSSETENFLFFVGSSDDGCNVAGGADVGISEVRITCGGATFWSSSSSSSESADMDMSDSESSLSIIVVVLSMVGGGFPLELDKACAGLASAEVESADDESVLLMESWLSGDSIVFLTSFKKTVERLDNGHRD